MGRTFDLCYSTDAHSLSLSLISVPADVRRSESDLPRSYRFDSRSLQPEGFEYTHANGLTRNAVRITVKIRGFSDIHCTFGPPAGGVSRALGQLLKMHVSDCCIRCPQSDSELTGPEVSFSCLFQVACNCPCLTFAVPARTNRVCVPSPRSRLTVGPILYMGAVILNHNSG